MCFSIFAVDVIQRYFVLMTSFTPVYDTMTLHCYWFERDLWWRSAPAPAPACLLDAVMAYPPGNDRNSQHRGTKNNAFGKSVQLFSTNKNTEKLLCGRRGCPHVTISHDGLDLTGTYFVC